MKIRPMTISDFDEVFALWSQLPLDIENYATEKILTRNAIKHNPTSCLVGIVNGNIVGAVLGTFDGVRGWFNHLGIDPEFQGKGYGKQLFKATEKELINRGAKKLDLFIEHTNNDKTDFYTKEGYTLYEGAVLVWKQL